jgi:hypothetical protein
VEVVTQVTLFVPRFNETRNPRVGIGFKFPSNFEHEEVQQTPAWKEEDFTFSFTTCFSQPNNKMMLAKTGVTKAGFLLLKRQGSYPRSNQWRSYFVVLNDHSLSYCSESYNFERPEGNVLLTSGTRVYHGEAAMIEIENGIDHLLLKGKDEAEMNEWMR